MNAKTTEEERAQIKKMLEELRAQYVLSYWARDFVRRVGQRFEQTMAISEDELERLRAIHDHVIHR